MHETLHAHGHGTPSFSALWATAGATNYVNHARWGVLGAGARRTGVLDGAEHLGSALGGRKKDTMGRHTRRGWACEPSRRRRQSSCEVRRGGGAQPVGCLFVVGKGRGGRKIWFFSKGPIHKILLLLLTPVIPPGAVARSPSSTLSAF
jgi:hypothetical protein